MTGDHKLLMEGFGIGYAAVTALGLLLFWRGASKARPARFASSAGSPSDAPSVQQAKCGMDALEVSKPSHVKAEGETDDLSRLVRLPVSDSARQKVSAAGRWRLHVLGPDDIYYMRNELEALREANAINKMIAGVKREIPNDLNEPWSMAIVEPPASDQARERADAPQRSGGERREANEKSRATRDL
jgi:hypothetical protein